MKWRLDAGQIEVVDDVMVNVLRDKTPAQKIEMISAANRTARTLMAAGIRQRHPIWDEEQIAAAVLRRLLGGAE